VDALMELGAGVVKEERHAKAAEVYRRVLASRLAPLAGIDDAQLGPSKLHTCTAALDHRAAINALALVPLHGLQRRRTYVTHAAAFEPMPVGDSFGDMMNAPKKYVVSRTLERPTWRDTTIMRENVIESVHALKAQPGKSILTDGSSQLVHALFAHGLVDELHLLVYPLTVGSGKRVLPAGVHATFGLRSASPYPTGVVGLHNVRQHGTA
jgi:dihydrofolate reductase